jgi:RNA polymerase sigma-70 factor (ECF subfamily)
MDSLVPDLANRATLRVIAGGAADSGGGIPRQLPSREDDDADLVRRVVAGQGAAAAAFHDRIRPVVDRTIARLLGVRDPDFEDLIQQALIELVTGLRAFRGECPLDAWTSLVSARVVYRHLRRRKLERRLFVVENGDGNEPGDRVAASPVALRNLVRRIEGMLGSMDAKKSWAFVLHDVHGYELSEIAQITGSSVAAAQSRLVRGRRELHDKISEDPELAHWLADFRKTAEGRRG